MNTFITALKNEQRRIQRLIDLTAVPDLSGSGRLHLDARGNNVYCYEQWYENGRCVRKKYLGTVQSAPVREHISERFRSERLQRLEHDRSLLDKITSQYQDYAPMAVIDGLPNTYRRALLGKGASQHFSDGLSPMPGSGREPNASAINYGDLSSSSPAFAGQPTGPAATVSESSPPNGPFPFPGSAPPSASQPNKSGSSKLGSPKSDFPTSGSPKSGAPTSESPKLGAAKSGAPEISAFGVSGQRSLDEVSPLVFLNDMELFNKRYEEVREWASADYEKNMAPFPKTENYALDGTRTRSKGECLHYNMLLTAGVLFRYDSVITITDQSGRTKKVSPDFLIRCLDGHMIIIEHLGWLGDLKYAMDFGEKCYWYLQDGFIPGKNFFITSDDLHGGTDSNAVSQVVQQVERMFFGY